MTTGLFIDIEELIIARLETKLATLQPAPRIYAAADLENAKDKSQSAAAVFVAYNGINNVRQMENVPSVVTLSQEFMVWIVARSASRHGSQQGTREKADPIIEGVLKALTGWRPVAGVSALALGQSPGPAYGEGFGYFPLVFDMKRQVRGED